MRIETVSMFDVGVGAGDGGAVEDGESATALPPPHPVN
jgi:hypothetical protein